MSTKRHDISIRLFPDNEGAKERLQAIAEKKEVSLNHLMNTLIKNALNRYFYDKSGNDPY